MKSAFDKICAGLEDAIAYAVGDQTDGHGATIDIKTVRTASTARLASERLAQTFTPKALDHDDFVRALKDEDHQKLNLSIDR